MCHGKGMNGIILFDRPTLFDIHLPRSIWKSSRYNRGENPERMAKGERDGIAKG